MLLTEAGANQFYCSVSSSHVGAMTQISDLISCERRFESQIVLMGSLSTLPMVSWRQPLQVCLRHASIARRHVHSRTRSSLSFLHLSRVFGMFIAAGLLLLIAVILDFFFFFNFMLCCHREEKGQQTQNNCTSSTIVRTHTHTSVFGEISSSFSSSVLHTWLAKVENTKPGFYLSGQQRVQT